MFVEVESALKRLLDFRTAEVYTEQDLRRKLQKSSETGKPLLVKLGVDPTAPDIHLGHVVCLRKMRAFQDLGHIGVLIIGDYTAMVGDPSGRNKTRPQLSYDAILANARTYTDQVSKVLDMSRTKIVFNGEWFKKLQFSEVIGLASRFTVARLLERDDFQKRFSANLPISLHELLYPMMQAYDSVMVEADVELGATEQTFNILMGRQLQEQMGREPQVGLLVPILTGTCGSERMSKSIGNYIGIAESPKEIFGKAMSIPDSLLGEYLKLATDFELDEIKRREDLLSDGEANPRDVKFEVAKRIVTLYHGEDAARMAASEFERVFKKGETPDEMPVVEVARDQLRDGRIWIAALLRLADVAESNSSALGLVRQGAVCIDGERVDVRESDIVVSSGMVLKVGKHRFFRLEVQE